MKQLATLAGGCFWCSHHDFAQIEGVEQVLSGFTGGTEENPKYYDVATGKTSHREGIQIEFDPEKVRYEQLLELFWRHIDPTDDGGQFADRGKHYTTAIYFHDKAQQQAAEASKRALAESGVFERPIVTEILPYTKFFPAEEAHQDYSEKNPMRYGLYREGSGRNAFIRDTWGEDWMPRSCPLKSNFKES